MTEKTVCAVCMKLAQGTVILVLENIFSSHCYLFVVVCSVTQALTFDFSSSSKMAFLGLGGGRFSSLSGGSSGSCLIIPDLQKHIT